MAVNHISRIYYRCRYVTHLRDNREYKVRWKGYSHNEDKWEPVSSLFDADWSITKYLASLTATLLSRQLQVDLQT